MRLRRLRGLLRARILRLRGLRLLVLRLRGSLLILRLLGLLGLCVLHLLTAVSARLLIRLFIDGRLLSLHGIVHRHAHIGRRRLLRRRCVAVSFGQTAVHKEIAAATLRSSC